ncbi:MAG TPA: hypothetical protein VFE57_08135 [Cyclobacteriaceae bacterium]|jgi:hypothetical protein|nr:hypothetical protein [Cyclobacteriaceae bacterium]
MENETFLQKTKRKTIRFFKIVFISAFILFLAVAAYAYWGVYEEGVWAGKVLSVSEKGVVFKTYEGKISMESFGALRGTSPIAETRDFSIEESDEQVIKDLQQVALQGDRVTLHFVRRYMTFPWRGDTKYFVTHVEKAK